MDVGEPPYKVADITEPDAMQQQQLSYYLSKYSGPPLHETGPHIKPGGHILG